MDRGATLLCALILLGYTGREAAAITVQSDSSINYLVGDNINLTISYDSPNTPSVSWYKDGVLLVTWCDGAITGLADQYQRRLEITGNRSLLIYKSTKRDSGNYTVAVAASADTTGTLALPVTIYDPVTVVGITSSPSTVDESMPHFTQTCYALTEGVTYTWMRDGQPLTNTRNYKISKGGQTLRMISPKRTLSGYYTCNVSNPVSWDSLSLQIEVFYNNAPSLSMASTIGVVIGAMCGVILLTEELWR